MVGARCCVTWASRAGACAIVRVAARRTSMQSDGVDEDEDRWEGREVRLLAHRSGWRANTCRKCFML